MNDFKTSELRDTSQELQELRAQLKEAQEAAEFNFQQYQDAGRLLCDAHEQLAASKAREQQLRDALEYIRHLPISEHYRINALVYSALTLPPDTPALEAMVQKAGDIMRERCATKADWFTPFVGGKIRALPGVTLDDLKGGAA